MEQQKQIVAIVVFQTNIDGKLAQCEVEADPIVLNSRDGRKDAENLARLAFANLHPGFEKTQKIAAVDIVVISKRPAGEGIEPNGN